MPPWNLQWSRPAERELAKLDPPVARDIDDGIREYARTGQGDVTKMKGSDLYRLRLGDWRVLFEIHHDINTLLIAHIGHRREVYR